MWKYIFWKAITSLISIFIIAVMFYFLFVGFNGNPFESQAATMKPKDYQAKLILYGISDGVWVRFWDWITGIFNGTWGPIYNLSGPNDIPRQFFEPLSKSMLVMIPSFFFGMFAGLGFGFWAGYKRGKLTDKLILGFVTVFIAVPSFVLAAFALVIGPMMGLPVIFQDSGSTALLVRSLIMPIVVMALVSLAGWTQLTRNFVSEILTSDYILAARTKGFSERTIFRKYVLRNALYPYAGSIATSFTVIFGSSLIVEKFFNVPGTATLLLNASKNGEVNVMMFNLLFFSSIGIFSQMIADVAQFMINPIVRANFSSKIDPITKLKYAHKRRIEAKNDIRS